MDSELRDMYADEEMALILETTEHRLEKAVGLLRDVLAMDYLKQPWIHDCKCPVCNARVWLKSIGEERE